MLPARLIPIYTFESLFWTYVAWSWFRWFRSGDDSTAPKWRKMTILFGFTLASFSTGLNIFMTFHAIVTGGYPFYHPVELFCIRAGSLASLVALLTVILGKGKLRIPTAISSSLTLFLWFADAMSQ